MKATWISDSIIDCNIPGAFKYLSDEGGKTFGFLFKCPCGCRRMGQVRFVKDGIAGGWTFNGNTKCPTVHPSINLMADDGSGNTISHWHGWLKDGEWIS